jgi:hypothetical protein
MDYARTSRVLMVLGHGRRVIRKYMSDYSVLGSFQSCQDNDNAVARLKRGPFPPPLIVQGPYFRDGVDVWGSLYPARLEPLNTISKGLLTLVSRCPRTAGSGPNCLV